jgi:zinc/manganese transport system permease protein
VFVSLFDLFRMHEFVQNAFFAGTMVAIISGVIGYCVVLRAQTFATDSLSHISFAGATGAVIIGLSSLIGMFVLTVLAALGMGALGNRVRGRDVETGMVLAFALGLGVLFLSIYTQGATEAVNVLFGSILSVSRANLIATLVVGGMALLTLICIFRPLLFASIDPEVAVTRGVPLRLLSMLFLLLLAITITVSVQVVGVLLVFALLIAPAAAAEHVTRRPFTSIALSIILGLVCVWGGLLLAFFGPWRHLPVSFYISVLAALCYFVALVVGRLRSPRRETRPTPRHQEPSTYIPVAGH